MKKHWLAGGLVLAGLCALVPFSSRLPDAVQKVTGLPGGVENFLKALGGVGVVVAATLLLGWILKRFKDPKP